MKNDTAVYRSKKCLFQSMAHTLLPGHFQKTSTDFSQANSYPLKDKNYKIRVFSTIREVPRDWDNLIEGKNLFQSRSYLEIVEKNPPTGMRFAYVLYYKNGYPIGLNVCQIVRFNAAENINDDEHKGILKKTSTQVKSALAKRIEFKLLVSGNMLLTGEHGYYFDPEQIGEEAAYELVCQGIEQTMKHQKEINEPVHGIMLKDIFDDHRELTTSWANNRYNEVKFQPNMILKFREDWTCFEDYLAAMSSKYRVRVRRARKKGQELACRELTYEEMEAHKKEINFLYKRIADKAGFNMIELNEDYLFALKRDLPEAFRIFAYYHNEKFVGFCTTIHNGRELEAHFLGFEEETNRQYQLYLNMLYDMIDIAFNTEGVKEVVFARTAMEIKSSVGAVAHDMYCYFKHPNSIFNGFVPTLIGYFEPKVEWQPRHPFK
jgi:hypothetical protein